MENTVLELKVKLAELEFLREQMELNQPDYFEPSYPEYEKKISAIIGKIVTTETALLSLIKVINF